MSRLNPDETPTKADISETLDLFRPCIQFLTPLLDGKDAYCLAKGTVPASAAVPIHSHAERETFYVLEGQIEGLWEDRWNPLRAGGVLMCPAASGRLGETQRACSPHCCSWCRCDWRGFLREIGRPLATVDPGPPRSDDLRRFVEIAHAYGYWLGSPADNNAVGISFV